ncbi:hypothetical protein PFY12_03955 [Chryseobacterium camelliae]|uniref:T9SS C-terminal target domain-containing protein n=1 Tax=Chryseobacterium camelliae TaxID=1265445 RepID=A0ABY7QNR3_9FLAO|nr:hypothetical protein [Chryseobacterium camelliae]WBV61280.1 hypothetical protein PFY12_03955 [Chryseobacterium camelliae]
MKKFFHVIALSISTVVFSQQSGLLKIKKYRVNYLDARIQETSGLNILNGRLYTFNDSGNTPDLFEINKDNGEIVRILKTNLLNTDWEALTNDGENFYVGDFGNNTGARKDLTIYKIPYEDLTEINPGSERTLDGTSIPFFYPEQTDFTPKNLKTDFDAEAMIYLEGKIHLFTKEWASKSTTHYIIDPTISEMQEAKKTESFTTNFVVTDAAYFDNKLYLVGYTRKTEVFLNIFQKTEPGIFFKEDPKRYYLGSALSVGQIEGIAVDDSGVYISGEKFHSPLGGAKQSLYFIPKDKLKD